MERKASGRPSLWPGPLLMLCTATSLFFATDPLRLSIVGSDPVGFVAKRVEQPSLLGVTAFDHSKNWGDTLNRSIKWFVGGHQGPESLVMDPTGQGPYTGVVGGRILKWGGDALGWTEFAYTSPNRSRGLCEKGAPMPHVLRNEHTCGRPLGLRFDRRTGDLYIADAYLGLMRVGPQGGQASVLVSEVDGVHLRFTNDLDVASDGTVYFTDSSSRYQRRNFFLLVLSGDDSGRVMRYDPKTGNTATVATGLQFPNGVSLSRNESFLVIAESVPGRLLRHWLRGPKAGSTEVLAVLPGYPDNVRRNPEGHFWVAMHCRRNLPTHISGAFPRLRRALLQLPIPFRQVYWLFNGGGPHGIIAKYDEQGQSLQLLEDRLGTVVKYASEVDERGGQLLIGSVLLPYIAVYDLVAVPCNPKPGCAVQPAVRAKWHF